VAAGATSANFLVTTFAVGTATQVTLSGTYNGSQNTSLTVNPPVISSVSVNPTSVTGGTGSTGTVTLNAAAPTGGAVVTLSSSNTSVASVPASVTVAAGATTATFPVSTSAIGTATQVTLTGTYNGSQNTSLTVNPPVISSVSVNPTSVSGGTGSTGTVTLNAAAPTGGAVVTLTSSNTSVASVPASVTVAAGAISANFPVSTVAVSTTVQVNFTASFGGSKANTSISVLAGAPIIVTQPLSTTVNVGQTATFTVVATGAAPLSYQWQVNGNTIDGATSSSYTTPTTVAGDDGSTITVIVTNSVGSATSNGANLAVNFPPQIQVQPSNQTVMAGETATFGIFAVGSANLSYQWLKNGANIPSATWPTYTTPPTVITDSGEQFSVLVTDSLGNSTSNAAILTVVPVQSPAIYYVDSNLGADSNSGITKDSPWADAPGMSGCFGNCNSIVLQAGDQVIFKGGTTWNSTGFPMTISWSGTSGQPIYFGVDPTWFSGTVWTRPIFDLSGAVSTTAPILASYVSNVTIDNIEIKNEQVNSLNSWPPLGSITIAGSSNVIISNCYIHSWSIGQPTTGSDKNPFGGIAFYDSSQQGLVQNCVIDGSPASNSGTGIYGGTTLQGNTIENMPNGIRIPGQTPNLVIDQNQISNVTNSIDPSISGNAIFVTSGGSVYNNIVHDLSTNAFGIYLQPPFAVTGSIQYLYNNLAWNTGPNPAVSIGPGFGTTASDFVYNNTIVAGPGSCLAIAPAPLVQLSLTVENNHCVSDQTSSPAWCWNSAGNNSSCGPAPSLTLLNNVLMTTPTALSQGYTVQNSFQPTGTTNSTVGAGLNLVTSCIAAGSALCNDRLGIARPGGISAWDAGAYEFQSTGGVAFAPSITSQPASQAILLGQTATFNVIAAGTPTLMYQWTRNGTAISGANGPSYTTPATTVADDGSTYSVVVSNAAGSVSSSQAVLTVNSGSGQLTASTNAVNFGNVGVAASTQVSITLTNTGAFPVHITGVNVSGAGFSTNGVAAGLTIDPGQAATLIAVFSPVALGNATGSVSVSSDAVNPNISISLQGTGGHSVVLTWVPGDSTPVFFYNVYRASVSGGPYTLVNSLPITTNEFVDTTVQAGQTYFYVVTTVNIDVIESLYSTEISVTVPSDLASR
ncbi:MAG: immunoglobulin domain-containing protein, partial [Candidatus Acidiferrales bacterium]